MDVSTFGPPVLKAIQTSIGSSLSQLNKIDPKDSTLNTLIEDYTKLNGVVTNDITNIGNYNATTFPSKLNDINNQLLQIDDRKVVYLEPLTRVKEVSATSILSDTWSEIKTNIVAITTIMGMIFGCIVTTHWFITADLGITKNTYYSLFYAIFGALLFPFPVIYGAINPPMWRAPLIPIFEKGPNSPAWVSFPGISLFTYITPRQDDLPIGRTVLRTMCIIVCSLIGATLYFKIK